MAIYSPRRSRWPLLLAVAIGGVVVGLLIGVLAFGNKPLDLDAAAKAIAAETAGSAGQLEVVEIEYGEAAASGFAGTEHQAALDNLDRSRQRYETVRSALAAMDPARVAAIDAGFTELEQLIRSRAAVTEVHASIETLRAALQPA